MKSPAALAHEGTVLSAACADGSAALLNVIRTLLGDPFDPSPLTFDQAVHLIRMDPSLPEKRAYVRSLKERELVSAAVAMQLDIVLAGEPETGVLLV